MPSNVREDGVTSLVARYLQDHDINVSTFEGVEIPGQGVKEPDYTLRNGKTVYGEAKWQSSFDQGIIDAVNYSNAPSASGTFVIAYPEKVRSRMQQQRLSDDPEAIIGDATFQVASLPKDGDSSLTKVSLQELPSWLETQLRDGAEPKPETDPDVVISILRLTAKTLTSNIGEIEAIDLFENVLGVDADTEEERTEASRRLTGYLLVNQLTFYRVLSAMVGYEPIEAEELDKPGDLTAYFDRVLDDDYTPIFSIQVAEMYEQRHIELIRNAVKKIYLISPERFNQEVLGDIFHELIPFTLRKTVAAFYTQNVAARLLTDLSIDDESMTVLDPACGSGTLLTAAYRSKAALTSNFTASTHKRFLGCEITGVDVMPFAAHLSTIHLALQNPQFDTDVVRIGAEDSTKLSPGDSIQPLSTLAPENLVQREVTDWGDDGESELAEADLVERGAISPKGMTNQPIDLDTVDLVIMNPPYTRQEGLSGIGEAYKRGLERNRFRQYEQYIDGRMGFSSYFFFIADRFLDTGGKMAVVAPSNTLKKIVDKGVRDLLDRRYSLDYVFLRDDDPHFSESTQYREMLLIATKTDEDTPTVFGRLNDPGKINSKVLEGAANELEAGDITSGTRFQLQKIETENLNPNNLLTPFSVRNPNLLTVWNQVTDTDKLVSLHDLDPGRIGGVRGGADDPRGYNPQMTLNAMDSPSMKSSDSWEISESSEDSVTATHRSMGQSVVVPRDCLVPNLRGFSHRTQMDVSNLEEYAVVRPFDGFETFEQLTGVDSIPVEAWRERVESRLAHIAIVRRGNLTAPGLCHMAYYSEKPHLGPNIMWMLTNVEPEEARLLASWFDSTIGWLQFLIDRIETEGGYGAWRGYTVDPFETLDPDRLGPAQRDQLLDAFEAIKDVEVGSLAQQMAASIDADQLSADEAQTIERIFEDIDIGAGFPERRSLDKTVLSILGVDEADQGELLDQLYVEILQELVDLKRLMND